MIISSETPSLNAAITKANPAQACIQERFLLTKEGSSKKTFHVSLNLENCGVSFKVGDSIGIFAENDPILVSHLIAAMKASGDEMIVDPRSQQEISLKSFLSQKANLSRLTSSFLKLFHEHETLHEKKNHLHRMLQQENKPLLSQYLSTHDPLDLFKEFHEVNAPLQEVCAQFGPLLPRFYSVASSQLSRPNHVDLTVALFTFTHSGEQRFGVASHFLCNLAKVQETPIPIYVQPAHHFTVPSDDSAPIIMIGPGTGVAAFRAFMQERMARGAQGKNWLFFGERNRETDYFYQEYWEDLVKDKKLRLDLAFSRDQAEKVYVQHKMMQSASDIWRWLQEGAYFYVCGDAHRMAKDVEATLVQIAVEQGSMSEESGKAFVKSLRTQKRYLADVY
ncbi:MAG: sulfite reductase flavoprotein subunit alpha [Parachlamydiales bacterium]|nr:sulfite reductase [Verrucomicrobiota bacterium]